MSLPSLYPSENSLNLSMKRFWCHWNWCSQSFGNEKDLAQHVIREHVDLAVRIDRHDILMHRRAEDGYGSTLAFSGIDEAIPEKPAELNTSKEADTPVVDQEPSSSLPSPPMSSPPLRMYTLLDAPDESSDPSDNGRNQSSQQNSNISSAPINSLFHNPPEIQTTNANGLTSVPTNFAMPLTPPSRPPRSVRAQTLNPTFASLSSPAGSPALASIPASPSFNSLVDNAINSRKRKDRSGELESVVPKKNHNIKDSHTNHTQSQSSTASQDSVARVLTQSDPEDVDIDAVGDIDEEALFTLSHNVDHEASEEDMKQYLGELDWEKSKQKFRHAPPEEPCKSQSPNPSVQFPLVTLSQPPSQLQVHSPSSVQLPDSVNPSQLTLDTSLPLDSIAPLQSPGFASSTPTLRQAWYQPFPIRKSWRTSEHLGGPIMSPLPEGARSPPVNMFRSGTLRIIPPRSDSATSPEGPKDNAVLQLKNDQPVQQDWPQTQSQLTFSEGDSQELSCPPLQTQAPYQSQSLSQSW